LDIKISSIWNGESKGWIITMDGDKVHFTRDEYQKDMFIAELKAKIKLMQEDIKK
jgi:hypothetical protein